LSRKVKDSGRGNCKWHAYVRALVGSKRNIAKVSGCWAPSHAYNFKAADFLSVDNPSKPLLVGGGFINACSE